MWAEVFQLTIHITDSGESGSLADGLSETLTWRIRTFYMDTLMSWLYKMNQSSFTSDILLSCVPLYFSFHWPYSPLGPWPLLLSFMIILQSVGLLGRVIRSSQGRYLNTGHHRHRINTYTHQTSVPCVGFEPMIPASERAKTVHALDRSATVTGPL
jgi:hypothetical protein